MESVTSEGKFCHSLQLQMSMPTDSHCQKQSVFMKQSENACASVGTAV